MVIFSEALSHVSPGCMHIQCILTKLIIISHVLPGSHDTDGLFKVTGSKVKVTDNISLYGGNIPVPIDGRRQRPAVSVFIHTKCLYTRAVSTVWLVS